MQTIKFKKKGEKNQVGVPFKFSFFALRELEALTGSGLPEVQFALTNATENLFNYITKIAYCGFKAGANLMDQDFNLSEDDIAKMIDYDLKLFTKVQLAFMEDMIQFTKETDTEDEEDKNEEDEKKLTGQ